MEYVFDAPPPPPPPKSTQTHPNRSRGRGRGRGSGRVSHNNHQHGNYSRSKQTTQASQTSSFVGSQATTSSIAETVYLRPPPPAPPPPVSCTAPLAYDGSPPISYDTPYLSAMTPPKPILYNQAGYALSSSYVPPTRPIQPTVSATPAHQVVIPPPLISGTNIALRTTEDVQAWIAQRKQRWPSTANVRRKLDEQEAKRVASAKKIKIETDSNSESSSDSDSDSDSDMSCSSNESGRLPDVVSSKVEPPKVPNQVLPASTLSTPVQANQVLTQAPSPTQKTKRIPTRPCKYHKLGRCLKGVSCTYSHILNTSATSDGNLNDISQKTQRVDNRHKWRTRTSLFERLVRNDIEKEDLVLAQVFKGFVDAGLTHI